MVNPIDTTASIGPLGPANALGGAGGANPSAGGASATRSFTDILVDSLNEVNRLQTEADAGVQRLLTGEADNVAEVFAASNKAGIAFDLLMEVRNKLLDAYREIQQIRV